MMKMFFRLYLTGSFITLLFMIFGNIKFIDKKTNEETQLPSIIQVILSIGWFVVWYIIYSDWRKNKDDNY